MRQLTRKPSRPKPTPHRNRSPYGWWIASYLERFEYHDEPKNKLNRRCLAWENTILIKARNRYEAYRKAIANGRLSDGSEAWNSSGRKGVWRYEGLTSLLPIYERLEDGAELLWVEHAGRTVKSIRSLVKSKRTLAVFNDSDQNERRGKKRLRAI